MYRLVEVAWDGQDGTVHVGDAMVEYVTIVEDGICIDEITNVYLPEYVPTHWQEACKEQVSYDFPLTHKGGF